MRTLLYYLDIKCNNLQILTAEHSGINLYPTAFPPGNGTVAYGRNA